MQRLRLEPPERTLSTHDIRVRVSDLNYGNHLGHDSLVSLLHEARVRLLAEHGMSELDLDGCRLMVADLAVQYRGEARLGQVLRVEVGCGDVGSRGCELRYRVTDRDRGTEVALARTGVVFTDRESGRVVSLPARWARVCR